MRGELKLEIVTSLVPMYGSGIKLFASRSRCTTVGNWATGM